MLTIPQTSYGLASKTDALNAHLDACVVCREAQRHDAGLCDEGQRLSDISARAYGQTHGQRLAEFKNATGT